MQNTGLECSKHARTHARRTRRSNAPTAQRSGGLAGPLAIYRHYRRRLAHALARGLALQIAIYGVERRVGPPTAAALRAAYPYLLTPPPCTIFGLRSSAARSPKSRTFFRKKSVRPSGA